MKPKSSFYALAILLLAIVQSSCTNASSDRIIVDKRHTDFYKRPMVGGICRFWYIEGDSYSEQEFEDSCIKYNIGDTITNK